jgi:hypothetical protein
VAVFATAPQPAAIEILSISLVSRGEPYLDASGVRAVTRDSITRNTLFAHAPANLVFEVDVPAAGRLDVGLACLRGKSLTDRVTVKSGNRALRQKREHEPGSSDCFAGDRATARSTASIAAASRRRTRSERDRPGA